MSSFDFDVLIIGTGIAGLSTAIKLAEAGHKIGLVTREIDPKESNTYWAQGGIIYPEKNDSQLRSDIQNASSHTSNESAIEFIIQNAAQIFDEVLTEKAKTEFAQDSENKRLVTKEAAHSIARILYKGDHTGKTILTSMLNHLKDKNRYPNVSIMQGHTAIDLLTALHHGISIDQRYEENNILGAYVFNQRTSEVHKCLAKVTVLATGGIGALYLHHSNAEGTRGDGHAMAKRAGAILTDMEFIQFHPTTFFNRSTHRRFLISEALRGEGGILKNCHGERFMDQIHPDRELAPRDVVARAIADEIIKTMHECVYLDISHCDKSWIQERFPTIFHHCLENGIDITKVGIPVVPAAHYTCGGVKTNLLGQTNLNNLYAVGEVACTGLHGANRLASTSLLEGLSFGYAAGKNIAATLDKINLYSSHRIQDWRAGQIEADKALIQQDWLTIKQTMWNYVGLTRSSNRLARADAMLKELIDEIEKFYKKCVLTDGLIGLRNAVEVGKMVLDASRRNKESIGCFYRKN